MPRMHFVSNRDKPLFFRRRPGLQQGVDAARGVPPELHRDLTDGPDGLADALDVDLRGVLPELREHLGDADN